MEQADFSFWILLLQIFAVAILALLVIGAVVMAWMYVVDVRQKGHTIRRNYPVIGRFRYYFEHLGEFFRQYFFAMDREEMPFNRAQRSWVYRAAKNTNNTVAFGSTANAAAPGTILFVPHPFPSLDTHRRPAESIIIGPHCRSPYSARSFFNVSGMSFGAISEAAVRALSEGCATAGSWLNTGEGGLSPYHLSGGCDLVFQIGTANYGVRDDAGNWSDAKMLDIAAHEQVKMIEIKLSQGAKPGKGGILPAVKVSEEIALIRGIPAGQASISPNGHPDIRNVEDLLDRITHIRQLTGKPVGFKLVVGGKRFFEQLFEAILRRGIEHAPDFMTIDSGDGGTGAAPQSLMDHAGLTIRESLPGVIDKLAEYGLRERIRVIVAGKLITPVDVAWGLCVGADFVVSARGFMFALGCIQAMQCNKNTCPTGVATQDPELQKGLDVGNKAARVAHYVANMVEEVTVIAHSCGVDEPSQLNRSHAHMVIGPGQSEALDSYYARVGSKGAPIAV